MLPTLPTAICGVVRAELLCGARDPQHRASLLTLLAAFHQVPISEPLWDVVGDHIAALRAAGVTVPFADIVIATVGVDYGLEVWTRDKQFSLMLQSMPRLRLFLEPP